MVGVEPAMQPGELRTAAQAAMRMKTVVGMPGTTAPISPSSTQISAKPSADSAQEPKAAWAPDFRFGLMCRAGAGDRS